jgi:putative Mg2+ transporter-C (MgtC) family protein
MFDVAFQTELALRLIVAAVLGAAIGAEREIHGHPAGIRTHMLVALGSALFTVLSIHGFGQGPGSGIDPTRIAAQVVTGIGFLGAGAILKDGVVIRGLTTAASLWATAAVGLATGAGEYLIATVSAVIILVSLWPINALAERLHGRNVHEIQLRLALTRADLVGIVSSTLIANKLVIGSIQTQRLGKDHFRADLAIRGRTPAQVTTALEALEKLDGVEVESTSQPD